MHPFVRIFLKRFNASFCIYTSSSSVRVNVRMLRINALHGVIVRMRKRGIVCVSVCLSGCSLTNEVQARAYKEKGQGPWYN